MENPNPVQPPESNVHSLSHIMAQLVQLRDPAKNWEIDLSSILDSLLKELNELTKGSLDINFAEAALVIQHSTGIYSLKVDYLWDWIMEVFQSRNGKGDNNKSQRPGRRRKTAGDSLHPDESMADTWEAVEDLPSDNQKQKPHSSNLKFERFVESELGQRIPSKLDIELFDKNRDKLGKRSDFRINSYVSSMCLLEDDLSIADVPPGVLTAIENLESMPAIVECAMDTEVPDSLEDDMEVDGGPHDDDHHDDGHHDDDHHDNGPHDDAPEPQQPELQDLGCNVPPSEVSEAEHQVFAAQDRRTPEEVTTVPEWPGDDKDDFRSKDVNPRELYKYPDCIEGRTNEQKERKLRGGQSEKELRIMADILSSQIAKSDLSAVYRFAISWLQELRSWKRRQQERRRQEEIDALRATLSQEFTRNFIGFEDYDYSSGEENGFRGYASDVPDDNASDCGREACSAEDFPNPTILDAEEIAIQDANGRSESGYQAILKDKLEEAAAAGGGAALSDLARRVNEWHETMRPVLEEGERRGRFDIHEYGTRVLNCFPQGGSRTTLPFSKIVEGKPEKEICRYFLSSLMLANTYNVEISKSDSSELAMDCMELTILKSTRHHEDLQDYEAPSRQR